MARLTLNLDTATDTFEVMVDGEMIPDVQNVTAWLDPYDGDGDGVGPEPHFEVCGVVRQGDARVRQHISARLRGASPV
jgi:hypothetical protein